MRNPGTMVTRWAVLALVTLVSAGSAVAGDRDHIGGFFLRMSVGGGFASTEITGVSAATGGLFDQLKFSGTSGDYNFAVGAMIAPNLALHGTLWGWFVSNPDAEIDGQDFGSIDGDFGLSVIGGGFTYYIMPANVYLSGSVGSGTLTADDSDSDAGIAIDASLGKEWWVGRKWGLGGALVFGYHSIPDASIDPNFTGTNYGVRFSVTFN